MIALELSSLRMESVSLLQTRQTRTRSFLTVRSFLISLTDGIEDGTYYIILGADGPCQISINLGGKIFRAHHDELEKGVISGATSVNHLVKKVNTKNFSKTLTKELNKK